MEEIGKEKYKFAEGVIPLGRMRQMRQEAIMTHGTKEHSVVVAMRKYLHKKTTASEEKQVVQRIEETVHKITKMLNEGDTERLVELLKLYSRVNTVVCHDGIVRKCRG